MKHLTIRDVSPDLARALEKEARDKGKSLDHAVKDLLERALGVTGDGAHDNGLGRFAGGWSAEELQAFEQATSAFELVDEEFWR